jgi:hypothetical protein
MGTRDAWARSARATTVEARSLDKSGGGFRFSASLVVAGALLLLAVCAHGLFARDTAVELARLAAERETKAAVSEHDAQLRLQLVGRALDAERSVEERQRVLRFLHAVTVDAAFKRWAEAELTSLQPDVDALHEAREGATDAGTDLRAPVAARAAATR